MILNNGFTISQAFMFCIGNKDKINQIFNYLYEIYHKSKISQNSILSNEIKLFKNSFENLCRSLKDSDVDLSKFDDIKNLKKKSDNIINQEKPSPIVYHFTTGVNWKGKTNTFSKRYYDKNEDEKEVEYTTGEEPTTIVNENEKKEKHRKI